MIELTAQLQQVAEELHCKRDITHVLRVATETRVKLKADAIPTTAIALVEGVHDCKTVEGVVLKGQAFIAFAC